MFGRLTLDAFVHAPVETGAQLMVVGGAVAVVLLLTYFKNWGWLYHEWLTSLDAKKIGIMYLVLTAVMLARGAADAFMMRAQQVVAVGGGVQRLSDNPILI